MRQLRPQLCYVFTIFAIFGVASTYGIATGKKDVETDASFKEGEETATDLLPTPIPSPSPSSASDDTDFSSRLGTTNSTTVTSKKELVAKGVKKTASKFKTRNKKSPAATAASFKSSQVAYPENESTGNSSPEESEGKGHQHDLQSAVQLELLDDKEGREVVGDSPDSEERGKYPRIYYGEADPPQHPSYISAEDEEGGGGPLRKNPESNHNGGDHNPKYFYPKNYVQNKHDHKRSKNKKKYEYKYAEDVRQLENPYRHHQSLQNNGGGGGDEPPTQQTPDSQYHGPDHYLGKENADGMEQEYGYGQNQGGGGGGGGSGPSHYGHYHGRDAAEIISKALHVLIPSALILTGLSAVFPNRIHVPTNDRYYTNNNNLIRHKRSIDYSQPSEILEPEHRSMSEEIIYPAASSYRNYNYEIGSPRGKYAYSADQSEPFVFKDFKEIPASAEEDFTSYITTKKSEGRKTSGFLRNNNEQLNMMMSRGPQNPQEFDLYQHNHGGQSAVDSTMFAEDSSFAPSSIPTPTIVAPPDSLNSVDYSPPQRPKRKMRTRTKIKVRQPNRRKSRPLPTREPVVSSVNDFQSQLIGSEKIPNRRQIMSRSSFKHQEKIDEQHAKGDFRLGDAYLKSMVEQHETEKAAPKPIDLSPDGAVMGLISSYAQHDRDSPACQKKALCELAIKGKNPNATKFETFLWSLASLVPEQFSRLYELDDIFKAVQGGSCEIFRCSSPNLDLQV